MTRDGAAAPVDATWRGAFVHASISPDGRQLAVVLERDGRAELWIRNLSDGSMNRLTAEGSYSYRPSWTRDSRSVLFVSDRSGKGLVYRVPVDGSAPPELVYDYPRGVDEAASSAGDEWAIVRVGSGGGRDIYGRRAGSSELVPLVATDAEEFSPAPSPDGRWLAYGSDETGRSEIYVRPFPGTTGGRWKVSLDGGTEPVWSNDGRELYYRSGGDLMAAEIAPGPEFRVVVRRRLFRIREYISDTRNRAYSIAPDGAFYFIAAVPGQQSQLIVVQNWFEELKARVR